MDTPICQCCGMPLTSDELFGKKADGTKEPDYCIHCCPDGKENIHATLEEMIEICAPIVVNIGLYKDLDEARTNLAAYLPTLSHWKKG